MEADETAKRTRGKSGVGGDASAPVVVEVSDVVRFGNGMFGKVVDEDCAVGGPTLTLLTLVPVAKSTSPLKPIFADPALSEGQRVFHFVLASAVVRLSDDEDDIYLLTQLKRGSNEFVALDS
jgi:hypothetical protein